MGKAERGTPKDIANRMKAKGLQKLRWYCQMCEKQCRDENGFKCHTMSESHQRQLLLFADNPRRYLDTFSREFLEGYLHLLKRQFGTKRVHANNVYQDYIHDRHHIHMNATKWETLTDFVKWLGREGHCNVDETEKGWYVAYIDRDPETIARQEKLARREKFEKDEEERFQQFIERQIERGKSKSALDEEEKKEGFVREGESLVSLDVNIKNINCGRAVPKVNPLLASSSKPKEKHKKESRKSSVLAEIMEEEEKRKRLKEEKMKQSASEVPGSTPWLANNIYVKVITKDLGSKYYKQKGVVKKLIDEYAAIVKLKECGTKLKLDQSHVETVVPCIGRDVLIVGGRYHGLTAVLKSIEEDSFSATLKLTAGEDKGKSVSGIQYEHFSKLEIS